MELAIATYSLASFYRWKVTESQRIERSLIGMRYPFS